MTDDETDDNDKNGDNTRFQQEDQQPAVADATADDHDDVPPSEQEEETEPTTKHTAHLWNDQDIPAHCRYGLTCLLIATLGLLFAADIGSGVQAVTRTVPDEEFADIFDSEETVLLEASVFSSIGELWDAGSYALAIFIVLTSICWPYIKLLLTLYAWCTGYVNAGRRQRLLVFLDALGKWSFVDIIVFIEIVVVFRATIPIGAGNLEVWVLPQWGLFGFISASMLSLLSTHVALYYHRKVMRNERITKTTSTDQQQLDNGADGQDIEQQHYNEDKKNSENGPEQASGVTNKDGVGDEPQAPFSFQQFVGIKSHHAWLLTLCLTASFALYLVGCILHIFQVKNIQQLIRITEIDYSLVKIGTDLQGAFRESDDGKERYMQIVWFALGLVLPLLCTLYFGILLWWPRFGSRTAVERAFFAAEILFAWSCGEVYFVSTMFGVSEFSKFGDGLVDVGCSQCYTVESEFNVPELLLWAIGGVGLGLIGTISISVMAHKALYEDDHGARTSR